VIAWELTGQAIEALSQTERPDPEPGPGQVLVRVQAVSLNHRDLGLVRRGTPAPLVPTSDGAGVVVDFGPGVTHWRAGDRVMANFFQTWVDGPWRAGRAGRGGSGWRLSGLSPARPSR
jgi:NADPH:quinone reductase-like Zn-dependent oxidoreductase